MNKEKMIRISISIRESEWITIQKVAEEKGLSASAMMRLLVSSYKKIFKE